MGILSNLEPKKLFKYFEDLTQIPRPSYQEKAVSDYVVNFAKEHGLEYYQDALWNVIIIKPATAGYENVPAVILQSHLDMVAIKDEDSKVDPSTQPLDIYIDGDKVRARGTTLGADDGLGVALTLAILDDDTLKHPRIEAVFTIQEEVTMAGAAGLDVSHLTAKRMMNLDGDRTGVFMVGCAGGSNGMAVIPLESAPCDLQTVSIRVDGMHGGHSGAQMYRGLANSNHLMGRVLKRFAEETSLRLICAEGGQKPNAIANLTTARIAAPETDIEKLKAAAAQLQEDFGKEFKKSENGIRVTVTAEGHAKEALTEEATKKAIRFLVLAPDGIVAMEKEIPDLVQTSANFGVLRIDGKVLNATISVRSMFHSEKFMVLDQVCMLAEMLGGSFEVKGNYVAWEYREDSPLRDLMAKVYEDLNGEKPIIHQVHNGLECGLLIDKMPGLDCVSNGCWMDDVHTTKESLGISGTAASWKYFTTVLERMTE